MQGLSLNLKCYVQVKAQVEFLAITGRGKSYYNVTLLNYLGFLFLPRGLTNSLSLYLPLKTSPLSLRKSNLGIREPTPENLWRIDFLYL